MVTKEAGHCQIHGNRPHSRPFPILLHPPFLLCADGCQQPQWDSRLHFTPNQNFYGLNEEVTLSCFVEDSPPLAVIRCAKGMTPGWKNAWEVKDNKDMWHEVAENLTCTTGKWRTVGLHCKMRGGSACLYL